MILYLLQSIPSETLFQFTKFMLNYHAMEIIITWLQVSVSECNQQTPD